ncbi:MAG TPA: hypothetical protein DCK98_13560 [Chloroflexi bacterium]|nr:hypothetical protein [Chloroflexota bacterium]HAL27868.1 hypothetical protein [Chloroflexota bacterium]
MRAQRAAKRFELHNAEGALIRISDSPVVYVHALPDEQHKLRSDPQLLGDGTGVCPECQMLVSVPFTSRQDER